MAPLISTDIWSLVFSHTTKADLYSLCRVSHTFYSIAIPLLYRSIDLIEPLPDREFTWPLPDAETKVAQRGRCWILLAELEDERNGELRNWVQELNLSISGNPDPEFVKHLEDDRLVKVIESLSNLRRVVLGLEEFATDEVIQTISRHPRKPELTLILHNITDEFKLRSRNPLPATKLEVSINPFYDRNGPNERMLDVQRLFFKSPNLRSFSISLYGNYGGCVMVIPRYHIITSFRLDGRESFPPLEKLELNGYPLGDEEWVYWRDELDWSKLSSLTIGPQSGRGLLSRMAGYATSLKTLRVFRYPDERWMNEDGDRDAVGLEALLRSFDGLTTLEVKGVPVSVQSVGLHKHLRTLCLHEDESAVKGAESELLTLEEVEFLDKSCPNLRDLKVKVKSGNNAMDTALITKIATSFTKLRSLSLHFEIGLANLNEATKPPLTTTLAPRIAEHFFGTRRNAGFEINLWFTLALWTGNYYRRWPQWEPGYAAVEKQFTATFELSVPNGETQEVEMKHLEDEELRLYNSGRKGKGVMAMFETQELASRVKAVSVEDGEVDGICEGVGDLEL